MRLLSTLFCLVGIAVPSFGGDYDSVIQTARQAWPERRTVVVVCNKDASSMALMDLGSATEKVLSLLVVDLPTPRDLDKVIATVNRKPKNEIFVLIVSDDPMTGDGTDGCKFIASRMAQRGVPVVGTTPASLKIGAVFAQGPATGDKVVGNPDVAKRLGVSYPETAAAPASK